MVREAREEARDARELEAARDVAERRERLDEPADRRGGRGAHRRAVWDARREVLDQHDSRGADGGGMLVVSRRLERAAHERDRRARPAVQRGRLEQQGDQLLQDREGGRGADAMQWEHEIAAAFERGVLQPAGCFLHRGLDRNLREVNVRLLLALKRQDR